jgi:DNA-binding NtrC family response regulator
MDQAPQGRSPDPHKGFIAVNAPAEQVVVMETVLVVEDEVLIRSSIADYLRHCGYRVLEAVNADEAMTILQKATIPVDVLFSGVTMPGPLNGFALAKRARDLRPGLEVILAGTVERAVHEAADLCEDSPLPKPYEPQVVVDRIKRLLAARQRQHKS